MKTKGPGHWGNLFSEAPFFQNLTLTPNLEFVIFKYSFLLQSETSLSRKRYTADISLRK